MSAPPTLPATDTALSEQAAAGEIRFLARRARDANRPLLVLAYCGGAGDERALLMALREALRDDDMKLVVRVPDEVEAPVLYDQLAEDSAAGHLAVVRGLPRDPDRPWCPTPTLLHYLNLHRDRIARERLRLVLLLRTSDAADVIATAPDLWDFRHATYWVERGASVLMRREPGAERSTSERERVEASPEVVSERVAEVRKVVEQTADPNARAAMLYDLSLWLEHRGPASESIRAAREALDTLPADEELEARINLHLADLHVDRGESDEAERLFRRSLDIAERLAAQEPGRVDFQRDLSVSLNNLADLHVARGESDEAERLFRRSLDIRKRLAAQEPGRADFQRDLAVSLQRLAGLASAEQAHTFLDRTVAIRRALHEVSPEQASFARDLAASLAQRGRLAGDNANFAEAATLLKNLERRGALEARYRPLLDWLKSREAGDTDSTG